MFAEDKQTMSKERDYGKEIILITCPICAKEFELKPDTDSTCPKCGAELFECSECGAIVESRMNVCPGCGVSFLGVEMYKHENAYSTEDVNIVCPSCNYEIGTENSSYVCDVCGRTFCDMCMGPHIPPKTDILFLKIAYEYKLLCNEGDAAWKSARETLSAKLPSPLCPQCYDTEFKKCITRLSALSNDWKTDKMREMTVKIVSEDYPETEEQKKMRIVQSARALLVKISTMNRQARKDAEV